MALTSLDIIHHPVFGDRDQKTETKSSLRNLCFKFKKIRAMDNVQNYDNNINVPPSQTSSFIQCMWYSHGDIEAVLFSFS
jgi:hypothetical protein